jgi:hypothetical protein
VAVLEVLPRQTPAERHLNEVKVEVDERLADVAADLEEWAAGDDTWVFTLYEGHESGKHNNVVAELVHTAGEEVASISFRLDQVERLTQLGPELDVIMEETDGIARAARLLPNGMRMEMFHILTYT